MFRALAGGLLAASLAVPATAQNANLTVIHGVPGLPAPVEVQANGGALFTFDFGDQAGPLSLPPATYNIDVVLNGNPAISGPITLTAGGDFTAIAHLDASGNPTLSLFQNDRSALSAAGNSRVDVRHLAEAGPVDIVLLQNGSTFATIPNISNGNNAVAEIPAGVYGVEVNAAGTSTTVLAAEVEFEAGRGYQLHAVGVALQPSFGLLLQRTELSARVTVIHGIPGLGAPVDVRNNNSTLFSFDFTDVAGPLALLPGGYNLSVAQGTNTLLSASPTLNGADDVTITANLDAGGNPTLNVFANDVSPLTQAGSARVILRHTAAAPTVNLVVEPANGAPTVTIPNVSNGQQAVAELPPGGYFVSVRVASNNALALGPLPIQLSANGLHAYHVIGDAGAGSLTVASFFHDLSQPTLARGEATILGTACGGTSIGVSATESNFGGDFSVTLSGAAPMANAFLVMGDSDTQSPFGSLPINLFAQGTGRNCFLFVNPMTIIGLQADMNGTTVFTYATPSSVARDILSRTNLYFQWVTFPGVSQALAASDYVEVSLK